MSNNTTRVPAQDSEFHIYQQEARKYLNTALVPSAAKKKMKKAVAVTAGSNGWDEDEAPVKTSKTSSPVFNWSRLGILPEEMDTLNSIGRKWDTTYPLTKDGHTRTPALVEEKTSIKIEFESFFRPLLNRMDQSPNITITDRNALRLPERDASRTRRAKIEDSPSVKITSLDSGTLKFSVRMNEDATRGSMNPLADAVEVRYKMGGDAPLNVEECVNSEMSKKSLFLLKTGNTNAGKKIWCYLRWVNLSSPEQSGPFGTLAQAVIQ